MLLRAVAAAAAVPLCRSSISINGVPWLAAEPSAAQCVRHLTLPLAVVDNWQINLQQSAIWRLMALEHFRGN